MNFIDSLVSAEFIRAFAWTLFHSLWQGGLLALIASGVLVILRKHRPGVRYAILYILMLCLPVFFIGTFLMIYHPGSIITNPGTQVPGTIWQTENSLAANLQSIPVAELPHAWYTYLVHLFENQAKWLVLFWFTGFSILLLRFSGSFLYVYRLKNHQVFKVDEHWNDKLHRLSGKIGIHQTVKLAESALAKIPITIGYFKPVILLPLGTLSGVPPQQIDAILLHELAHILRKDYLWNIIQSVVELMFFYHPVTWWLSGLIRQEREHICDDLAVAVNQDHINYIKALTTMEELNVKSPLLASAISGSKKKLLYRVKRLLSPVKLRKGFSEGIIAFILLVSLILTLSMNALSFIPNAYDLTGRESGERVYSLLPMHINTQSVASAAVELIRPEAENSVRSVTPDTIISTSKSGKVTVKVYIDSTSQLQQENLNRMAESMDRQTQQFDKARKEYQIQIEKFDEQKKGIDKECKVIVIRKPDSLCPVPPDGPMFNYRYSCPAPHGMKDCREQFFTIKIDSIDGLDALDSVIIMSSGACMKLNEIEGMEWPADSIENQMREIEMEIMLDQPEGESENLQYYYNQEFLPPPPMREFALGHQVTPGEEIIRQELWDDGLINQYRKYIIEIDSKAMYINGVKQPKEISRKYKRLAEGLENMSLDDGGIYRIIF